MSDNVEKRFETDIYIYMLNVMGSVYTNGGLFCRRNKPLCM